MSTTAKLKVPKFHNFPTKKSLNFKPVFKVKQVKQRLSFGFKLEKIKKYKKLKKSELAEISAQIAKCEEKNERQVLSLNLFKSLSRTKNHSEVIIANLVKHSDSALAYVEYFMNDPIIIAKPELYLPILIRAFKEYPEQAIKLMSDLADILANAVEPILFPSQIVGLYEELILHSNSKEFTMAMMDAMKPLSKATKVAEPELQDYLSKWAKLASIEVLENLITTQFHQSVGKIVFAEVRNPASRNSTGVIKSMLPDVRGGDLVTIEKDGSDAPLFTAVVSESSPNLCCIKLNGNAIEIGASYVIKKVTTLNTYRSEMEALVTFTSKGPACTDAYPYIMQKNINLKAAPIVILPKSTDLKNLNKSQISAIESAIEKPVSLIQGPPGSGKTHTLSKLIKVLTRRHGPGSVLVCAPTNAACDNVVQYTSNEGLRVVRLGDLSSVREDLLKYTIDYQVANPILNFAAATRVIKRADVVCTTCASAGSALLRNSKFRYVIIDEASQLTETIALIPIVRNSSSVILIGDHKQLPPSVGHWAKMAGYSESLFARLADQVEPKLLDTQYRSHPLIMEFPSTKFYNGELKNGVAARDRHPPVGFRWKKNSEHSYQPVAFVNSDSSEFSTGTSSKSNTGEADLVMKILHGFLKNNVKQSDIGIISPYSGQNKVLRKMLQKSKLHDVELNSVDAYQGREKEIIIFSATRSNNQGNIGFLSDPRRFNVMHTRAKRGLIIVGNRETLCKDFTWKDWINWIDRKNLQVYL